MPKLELKIVLADIQYEAETDIQYDLASSSMLPLCLSGPCWVLSGCRVVEFRVLSGGIGLSGLCRGEQPYFVVSGLHQGLTQTTTNKELRNRTQHAYLEIYARQNFFKPRVFSSTPAF